MYIHPLHANYKYTHLSTHVYTHWYAPWHTNHIYEHLDTHMYTRAYALIVHVSTKIIKINQFSVNIDAKY